MRACIPRRRKRDESIAGTNARRELTIWSNEWTIRAAPHFLCLRHVPRHVVHTSVRPPPSLLSPWLTPWSSLPSRDLSLVLLLSLQHSKAWLFHGFTRAPFLHFFFTPVHITTNYVSEQPSLLAGLLNGYNLALFTTRAARSPVWQVLPWL